MKTDLRFKAQVNKCITLKIKSFKSMQVEKQGQKACNLNAKIWKIRR